MVFCGCPKPQAFPARTQGVGRTCRPAQGSAILFHFHSGADAGLTTSRRVAWRTEVSPYSNIQHQCPLSGTHHPFSSDKRVKGQFNVKRQVEDIKQKQARRAESQEWRAVIPPTCSLRKNRIDNAREPHVRMLARPSRVPQMRIRASAAWILADESWSAARLRPETGTPDK